jgi:hypothetical protein
MTSEARKKTRARAFDLTYFKVSGRLNIQTSETSGFSLKISSFVWAIDEAEAAKKAEAETAHFYQGAYPHYTLKTQFLNGGAKVKTILKE